MSACLRCKWVEVLPVEVYLAVDLAVPGEALLVEDEAAVDAADTVGVPGLVQHRQHVLVQDGLLARRALHQHRVQVGHGAALGAVLSNFVNDVHCTLIFKTFGESAK